MSRFFSLYGYKAYISIVYSFGRKPVEREREREREICIIVIGMTATLEKIDIAVSLFIAKNFSDRDRDLLYLVDFVNICFFDID